MCVLDSSRLEERWISLPKKSLQRRLLLRQVLRLL
jgi:hypothetical protein